MIKRFEIVQKEDSTVELQCVESFDVVTNNNLDIKDILTIIKECYLLDILDNEHVYVVSTNYYGKITGTFLVSIGDYKECNIYNRSIAIFLLLSGAKKFVLIHNHPDSQIFSSTDDVASAMILDNLGKLLGIDFMGSYIVGKNGWCRVLDENKEITKWEEY